MFSIGAHDTPYDNRTYTISTVLKIIFFIENRSCVWDQIKLYQAR